MKLKKMILAAILAALTCVATMVITIPAPTGGYFNLGDCIVILSGLLLGPAYGAIAAGLGSALADLLSGFATYAPATFVIKALMALGAALLCRLICRQSTHFGRLLAGAAVGGVVAECIMVLGYFLFESLLYDPKTAFTNALFTNLPQAAVGLTAALLLFTLLDRSGLTRQVRKLTGGQHYGN